MAGNENDNPNAAVFFDLSGPPPYLSPSRATSAATSVPLGGVECNASPASATMTATTTTFTPGAILSVCYPSHRGGAATALAPNPRPADSESHGGGRCGGSGPREGHCTGGKSGPGGSCPLDATSVPAPMAAARISIKTAGSQLQHVGTYTILQPA